MESDKSEEAKKETTGKSTDETAETEETTENTEITEAKEGLNDDQKSFLKFLGIVSIVLLSILVFKFYGADGSSAISGNVIASDNGGVQIVKMHVEGGQYILEPSSFKAGTPVRIEADMSRMPGCSKSIVISAFGVKKSLSAGDNIIQFTPTKAGTFNIACSMNMYRGTFTVLEASGAKSDYVEQASSSGGGCGGGSGSGGGCGGGGGGCGCGG